MSSLFADLWFVIYCGKTLEIETEFKYSNHFNLDNCREKWYDSFNDIPELADKNILEEAVEDEAEDKEEVEAEIWPTKRMIYNLNLFM